MKKQWFRLCCLILALVMTVNSLPMTVFAEEYQSSKSTPQEASTVAEQLEQPNVDYSDAQIVEENVDSRTEFSKEFLLDSGVSLAVLYDSAVHYEKNGKWEEIDNTLQAKSNGTLTNTAGIWDVSFPQQLSKNNQISITKDGYTLSFGMAGELRQQGNLEVMSTGEAALINGNNEPTPTIAPEKEAVAEPSIEATIPEETSPAETTPEDPAAKETIPRETEPNAVVPLEGTTEIAPPEETVATESEQEEVIPQESIPEDAVPAETIPPETIPEETTQEETLPAINDAITELPKLEENTQTTSVVINGTVQTFAVSTMNSARGQIQTVDRKEVLEAADHEETVLEKPVSKLMYADVYTNTDVQYDLVGNQVKESIIMDSYNDGLRGYQFRLNTGKLVPVLEADGHIDFYDEAKENIIMVMPAPYLVDDKLVLCDNIQVNLSGKDGVYTLTYILPQQWLAEEDRAWPVILDPVISADINVSNIRDKTIGSKFSPGYEYEVNELGVGPQNGIQYSYLMYKNLPELTSSDVILNATISMRKYRSYSSTGTVEVHKVKGTWESTTLTWSNKPGIDEKVDDYIRLDSRTWYSWDVTDIARGWYAGDNTGMMFKVPAATEANTSAASWIQFYSSDNYAENRPVLAIYFRNNNGLESYWDYTSFSAGRAGTGHVSQYTGNLVWVHDDIGFGGNRMPVSISHIYNANDSTNDLFGVGYGWRTNFNQRVYQWTSDTNYYIWEDSDGTMHYFQKESTGIYKDEDGLELTLTNTGSGTSKFCITDKYGNKSFFDTYGRLTKQENNQATRSNISITYKTTSGYLIQTITDGAGRKYNFEYNSSNLLNKITYVGNGSVAVAVSYGYTNGNLTSVTYQDGKKSTFTYGTNNLLTSATDIDGYALKFEYNTTTAGQPNRVSKVSEFDGSAAGGILNFEYAHNQTTCTDHNGNVQILQFNNMGNTVCIQDGEGHAQYAKYAKDNAEESGKGNQLTASSKLQNTVGNLLADSSFENNTLWTAASGSRSIASSGYLGSKSLAVTGGRANSATFTVAGGESCTFSAYVKTTGSGASLVLYSGSSAVATQTFPACSTWTRVEVNYTNTSSSSKSLNAAIQCASGQTVYMDCVQVEKAPTASRYNLVQNGDFSFSDSPIQYWTSSGTTSGDGRIFVDINSQNGSGTGIETLAAPQLDTYFMKLVGNPTATKKLSQTIAVSGSAGDTYVVSGWALADSVPLYTDNEAREFGIRLIFNNADSSKTTTVARFNPDTNTTANWQYSAAAAVADKAYSSITVELAYDYNANAAYFDGIQVYKEAFSQSYTYHPETGNLISVTDLQKQTTTYEYDTNDNLIKEILPSGAQLTYVYDNYHNVTQATTDTGVVYKFTYDTYGNNTAVEIVSGGKSIKSSAAYSTDGNRMTSATDATGKTTTYDYDANTNVLNSVQYPNDSASTKTNYTYDSMYRMETAAATTNTNLSLSANYTYTDDMLASIQTGSTTYTFGYGDFALRNSVKIGSRTLASYTYTSQNNYLDTLAYGNGDSVKYTYDQQGRVTKQTYEDNATVTYRYDNDGALANVVDSASGISTTYYYDFIDRLMKYVEIGSVLDHSVAYEYDTDNNLSAINDTVASYTYSTEYSYDDDNRVSTVARGNAKTYYTYDAWGRVSAQRTEHGRVQDVKTDSFTFKAPTSATTSSQVTGHTISAPGYNKAYTYTYDNNGNILSVSVGGKTVSYEYDSANQLVRENNQIANKTTTWTYDNAGNIKTRKEYAYTTGTVGTATDTVNYTYGDSSWKDLLTAYDGNTITYDGIGNPLSDGTRTYTWKHGRQLATIAAGGTTWTNTYNADGLRTSRTNGSTTYHYFYNGDKLTYVKKGSEALYIAYDGSGKPMALVAPDNDTYYYVTNLQGDVIAILNKTGTVVVEYTYDAWGNIISTTGSMASTLGEINPLRYRGYVYDQEYELYYLQSRYYNPEVGRFLNADTLASTGQGTLGCNPFVYCLNNPVNNSDPNGELAFPGQIHNEVVRRVATDYRFYKEQKILYEGGKWGRADLISPDGQVWDVKRDKPKQIEAGINQVQKYVANTWKNSPNTKLSVGDNIVPTTSFNYKSGLITYKVQYRSVGNGVIAYDYWITDIDTKTATQMVLIAGTAAVLGVLSAYTGLPLIGLA